MLNIVFKNKQTGETWIDDGVSYMCLTTNGQVFHWRMDYGSNWYYSDVTDEWTATVQE